MKWNWFDKLVPYVAIILFMGLMGSCFYRAYKAGQPISLEEKAAYTAQRQYEAIRFQQLVDSNLRVLRAQDSGQ